MGPSRHVLNIHCGILLVFEWAEISAGCVWSFLDPSRVLHIALPVILRISWNRSFPDQAPCLIIPDPFLPPRAVIALPGIALLLSGASLVKRGGGGGSG